MLSTPKNRASLKLCSSKEQLHVVQWVAGCAMCGQLLRTTNLVFLFKQLQRILRIFPLHFSTTMTQKYLLLYNVPHFVHPIPDSVCCCCSRAEHKCYNFTKACWPSLHTYAPRWHSTPLLYIMRSPPLAWPACMYEYITKSCMMLMVQILPYPENRIRKPNAQKEQQNSGSSIFVHISRTPQDASGDDAASSHRFV